jgi:hypothetical protein
MDILLILDIKRRRCILLQNFTCFLADVNSYRAPRYAAATPHTSHRAELIDPCCQFMAEPLSIARCDGGAYRSAVHIREILRETGIPSAPAPGAVATERIRILYAVAKAGRANHRAIAARQAFFGRLIPAGVLKFFEKN